MVNIWHAAQRASVGKLLFTSTAVADSRPCFAWARLEMGCAREAVALAHLFFRRASLRATPGRWFVSLAISTVGPVLLVLGSGILWYWGGQGDSLCLEITEAPEQTTQRVYSFPLLVLMLFISSFRSYFGTL